MCWTYYFFSCVFIPLQSLSVCGQPHKVFDICRQFAWDIFLFQVRKDGNGFFFPQEWTSQSNNIFMIFVADWIIFHSLCSQLAVGIESLPLKHDSLQQLCFSSPFFSRTWQPCPIQTCALLPFIVRHKWMVRLSTLEARVIRQGLYSIMSQGKSHSILNNYVWMQTLTGQMQEI